jgi:hypothetical protein
MVHKIASKLTSQRLRIIVLSRICLAANLSINSRKNNFRFLRLDLDLFLDDTLQFSGRFTFPILTIFQFMIHGQ